MTVLAALLRFTTLGIQCFTPDEAVTAALARQGFGSMLSIVPHSESTPYLYYVLAWLWAHVFGTGEAGLRSLSALIGTAAVPVVYLTARRLVSESVALFATLLAAVSPALVWYSQEARAYSLLFLLSVLSIYWLDRALEERRRPLIAAWAVTCALALLTHYFAIFLVVAEAALLLLRSPDRRASIAGCAGVAAVAGLLVPLGIEQAGQGNADWIGSIPLATRLRDAGSMALGGETGHWLHYAMPALAALALAGAALLLWHDRPMDRSRALLVGGVSLAVAAVPLVLDLAGRHYVIGRNLLPLWLPLALVVAAGVAGTRLRRLGLLIGAGLVLGSLAVTLAVPMNRDLQRDRINAQLAKLAGMSVDLDHQRVDTMVEFDQPGATRPAGAAVACPDHYAVAGRFHDWIPSAVLVLCVGRE